MIEVSNLMEHGGEPVRGLPGPLPAGERLLWQGRPGWWSLAVHAFRVRAIALYFAILMVWRGADVAAGGASLGEAVTAALWLSPLAGACLGILLLLAFLAARATVYTITSRRLVIRGGIALQVALNVPFKLVGSAALRSYRDGSGDIPLQILGDSRISYLVMWPHVRPWRMGRPEPTLRCVPDAAHVAATLAHALADCVSAEVPDAKVETTLSGPAMAPSLASAGDRRPRLVSVMGSARA
ncbi:MAG: putative photosynthetic complex assembly protein PuhB [Pseudomonadota bacterium]|jgi:hypothetical protein